MRALAAFLLSAVAAFAAQTTISDTVSSIGAVSGDTIRSMSISNNSFTAADGTAVSSGIQTVTLGSDGTFTVALSPNAGTSGTYKVTYTGYRAKYTENLSVPQTASTITLAQARNSRVLQASSGPSYLLSSAADFTPSAGSGTQRGISFPSTCTSGDTFVRTDQSAGSNLYICGSSNSWTLTSSGGGGAAAWGSITGTLASQTDLNTALAAKTTTAQAAAAAPVQSVSVNGGTAQTGAISLTIPVACESFGASTSASAAANTTALQSCLNQGGSVTLLTPGVFQTNTLSIGSNTKLSVGKNTTIKQGNGNNSSVLVTHASTTPWNTSGVSVSWTSGLEATLTWPTHALSVGDYVWVAGTTAYLSGTFNYSTGASACTNGTQAVTFIDAYGSGATGTITVTGGVPTGAITITNGGSGYAPLPTQATIATCTGTATITGGTISGTDSAYEGLFPVKAVTDANNVVISLRREPAVAPSNLLGVKKADVNVAIDGGTWDFNAANNSGAGHGTDLIDLGGVQNLQVLNISGENTQKYMLVVYAVRDFHLDGAVGLNLASDGLKVYGPAFDGTVERVSGIFGDDITSVQPQEAPPFAYQWVTGQGGDTLNIKFSEISGNTPWSTVAIYPTPYHQMDSIILDRIAGHNTGTGVNVNFQSGNNWGFNSGIKSVDVHNMQWRDDTGNTGQPSINVNGSMTIDRLSIDGVTCPANPQSTTTAFFNQAVSNVIHLFAASNIRCTTRATINNALFQFAGQVDSGEVSNFYFGGASGSYGGNVVMLLSGSTVSSFTARNGTIQNASGVFNVVSGASGTPNLILRDTYITGACCTAGVSVSAPAKVYLANNAMPSGSYGLVRLNNTTATVYSNGGNTAGTWLSVVGTPTLNLYACDFQVDLSQTYVGRTIGGCAYNTNAALGTLVTAGPVWSYTTASGGWHNFAGTY